MMPAGSTDGSGVMLDPFEDLCVIVPTIGRPQSLRRLLSSLAAQSVRVKEVVVADGSETGETAGVTSDPCWMTAGLAVRRIRVRPPHAVRQREAAIAASTGELLLFVDDDVELEVGCIAEMVHVIRRDPSVVAVTADFSNQGWSQPTRAWRAYLRIVHGLKDGEWQGRVVGPLLRYGYDPVPPEAITIEWLGTCNSLVRRAAFEEAGGFSGFFLHRSTMNEDVDLGLKLARVGSIVFCPKARMAHYHDPSGRVSAYQAAEDDLHNRYCVLQVTMGKTRFRSFGLVVVFAIVETMSGLAWCAVRGTGGFALFSRTQGRIRAMVSILARFHGVQSP